MAKNPTWIFQIPAMGSEVWFPGQLWCDAALAGPSLLLSHTHPSGAWNPSVGPSYPAEVVLLTALGANLCHLLLPSILLFLTYSPIFSLIHVSPTVTFAMSCDRLGVEWREMMAS